MSPRRNLILLLVGLALIVASIACGGVMLGAAPERDGAASSPEEPAAPAPTVATAPEEPVEPVEEPPAAEEAVDDFPPSTPKSAPMPTPTLSASLPDTEGGVAPAPVITEHRRLTLEFPPVMRTGDSTRIRLQLEVDDRGNFLPTAVVEGNIVTGEVVEIPNLYETHIVIAEARLDIAGMEVQPSGTISEPMSQGQSVTFYWSVRPEEAGKYEGTAWLHLRFVSKTDGQEGRIPVSVQFLEIEANSFLGFLPGNTARGLGAIGSAVGSVLGIPFFEDIVRFVLRRPKRRR